MTLYYKYSNIENFVFLPLMMSITLVSMYYNETLSLLSWIVIVIFFGGIMILKFFFQKKMSLKNDCFVYQRFYNNKILWVCSIRHVIQIELFESSLKGGCKGTIRLQGKEIDEKFVFKQTRVNKIKEKLISQGIKENIITIEKV